MHMNVIRGPVYGGPFELREGDNVAGRAPDCDVCLPSKRVSRRHCVFTLSDGRVFVRDLGSHNGIVDGASGRRVDTLMLSPGGRVQIGDYLLALEVDTTDAVLEDDDEDDDVYLATGEIEPPQDTEEVEELSLDTTANALRFAGAGRRGGREAMDTRRQVQVSRGRPTAREVTLPRPERGALPVDDPTPRPQTLSTEAWLRTRLPPSADDAPTAPPGTPGPRILPRTNPALEAQRAAEAQRALEIARAEATRLENLRQEAARLEAIRLESARLEATRLEAARIETARLEAARLEAARAEGAREEAARQDAARQEATRQEAARLEAARLEAARQEAARQAGARREAPRQEGRSDARADRARPDTLVRPERPRVNRVPVAMPYSAQDRATEIPATGVPLWIQTLLLLGATLFLLVFAPVGGLVSHVRKQAAVAHEASVERGVDVARLLAARNELPLAGVGGAEAPVDLSVATQTPGVREARLTDARGVVVAPANKARVDMSPFAAMATAMASGEVAREETSAGTVEVVVPVRSPSGGRPVGYAWIDYDPSPYAARLANPWIGAFASLVAVGAAGLLLLVGGWWIAFRPAQSLAASAERLASGRVSGVRPPARMESWEQLTRILNELASRGDPRGEG